MRLHKINNIVCITGKLCMHGYIHNVSPRDRDVHISGVEMWTVETGVPRPGLEFEELNKSKSKSLCALRQLVCAHFYSEYSL